MAPPTRITAANFATLLVESSEGRSGTPDGNIYFDTANDRVEIITREELAQVDLGAGLEDNPLADLDGIELQALYAFERQQRRNNLSLRAFLAGVRGVFQDAGAWQFLNGVKLADGDRRKVRGTGWTEVAANGNVDRIYFGVRSLNDILATSRPFVQIAVSLSEADLQAAAPIDAQRLGPLDEAFQVFGSTANGDAAANDFDWTARELVAGVRTFGQTSGRATSTGSGVGGLQAFSAGFGIGEAPSPSGAFTLANVFGGAAIAPFTGINFERFESAQTRTGFNQGAGLFTDIVSNAAGASLAQIRARLDALMIQDTNQDQGDGSFIPKRAEPLYTIDADGRLVTRRGLHIDNVPVADRQSLVQTADDGSTRTYPFIPEVRMDVSDAWAADPNGWYDCYIADGAAGADFGTENAVILNDSNGDPVRGVSADAVGVAGSRQIRFGVPIDTITQAGLTPGQDFDIVFVAEGDGGATAASTRVTVTRSAIVSGSARADAETNI